MANFKVLQACFHPPSGPFCLLNRLRAPSEFQASNVSSRYILHKIPVKCSNQDSKWSYSVISKVPSFSEIFKPKHCTHYFGSQCMLHNRNLLHLMSLRALPPRKQIWYTEFYLLGYVVQSTANQLMFQRNISPSSGLKSKLHKNPT